MRISDWSSDVCSSDLVDGKIAVPGSIMQEIIADQFDFVAAKDHEIPNALMRVEFHDMPHDGATADLHHWLGLDRGFLTQAGSETTGEQRDLHADTFSEEGSQ